jgi:hypothetical protein
VTPTTVKLSVDSGRQVVCFARLEYQIQEGERKSKLVQICSCLVAVSKFRFPWFASNIQP